MSDTHGSDHHTPHPADAHDPAPAHGDAHDHGGPALGATDWKMWGAGVVSVIAALAVTAGFVVATGFVFGA